jgi:hypothetical protein
MLLAAAGSASGASSETAFALELTGNAAARVEVTCEIDRASGAETVTVSGAPPIRRSFEGRSLTCRIRQTAAGGRVDIHLRSSTGNVSRLATAGAGSRVQIGLE